MILDSAQAERDTVKVPPKKIYIYGGEKKTMDFVCTE